MELKATVLREGREIAAKSDYFSCARNVHQVMIEGIGPHGGWQFSGTVDKRIATYPQEFITAVRNTYGNYMEKFAWGPSDFDNLTPDTEKWWAGQTQYNESRQNITAVIAEAHRQGIKVVTYGKTAAGGTAGYEKMRRQPDLVGYTNGRFWGSYDAAYLDFLNVLGPPKNGDEHAVPVSPAEMEKAGYAGAAWFTPFTNGNPTWCDVWYDCADPRLTAIGIGELTGSAKMFGFDGVRFDGEFTAGRSQRLDGSWNIPENYNVEGVNSALVQQMKGSCWAAKAGYLFGYNSSTDISWSIGKDNVPASFREKCKDGGLIANESMAFPGDIPWTDYCLHVRHEEEIVRHYGGYYATYAFNRNGNSLYNYLLEYGLRTHQMVGYTGAGADWVNRSATRFSRLLWDDSLSTWHDAAATVSVQGSRELLWKETAAIGQAPDGGTRYVLHLFNMPEAKTTLGDKQLPAAPATGVTVTWQNLQGMKRAFLVDMEKTTAVPITATNGTFTIGELPYWKILVVDTAAPCPPPVFDEPAGGDKTTTPSAADLQLVAPPPAASTTSWQQVLEPAKASIYATADADAFHGAAVHSKPMGLPVVLAYLYAYPRIPGHYRATFHLKVANNTSDFPVAEITCTEWNNNPLDGVPQTQGDVRRIHANEFAKANVYQDFTVEFDHSDVGFREPRVIHHGTTDLWWDRVTLELVHPWTDAELAAHYTAFKRPANLAASNDANLHLLVVRGLYNRLYHIDDAAAALPKVSTANAYTAYTDQSGTLIKGMKWDWQSLWKQNIIVLANVETKGMNYGQVLMLAEWVKNGGALIILGGNVTLGQDENMAHGWPLFLPVELNGPWEIRKCAPPVKLAGTGEPAMLFYRHMVKPKPGATVLLKGTNNEPLFVGMPYGKGRVAVFTGTVLGEAAAGLRAFWETPAWTKALAGVMRWAVKQ